MIRSLVERRLDANACPSLGYSRDERVAEPDRRIASGPDSPPPNRIPARF